ncbi:DUF6247 family protein [Actinomycetospora termitidis]|uniref:DUF6247 family protein n=1 Tax=Actinomycetospora termitidis TaxID=3053470 RepID=A0ABT7M5P4_9PSEU|nr:DUF6247 family protein [Actinomycetospora sp. Odt1-22]MDL5155771.1 DUF6247 family protein [Actinomycetospora sp. Odt1-22]
MAAQEARTSSHARHPLSRGAGPEAVHDALLDEDRAGFRQAFANALDRAKHTLDLTPVFETLEDWRHLAVAQSDPDGWRHAVRRAAELRTGVAPPEDEPVERTRTRSGI